MTVSPTSALPVTLGQATQIQAPAENIAQFKALISGIEQSLGKSNSSLDPKTNHTEWAGSSLLEDTAIRVRMSERAISSLQTQINNKTNEMAAELSLNGVMPRAMTEQRMTSVYYFVGLSRAGDSSQNFSEELQSLTRGR